jgi:hypothetical protein
MVLVLTDPEHNWEVPLSRLQSFPFQALMIASSIQDSLEVARGAKDLTEVRAMLGKIETRIDALIDAARAATTETKEQAADANRA